MLLTIDASTWMYTGIGISVVFAILVILVLVLQLFNLVAKKASNAGDTAKAGIASMPAAKNISEASELDKAAVATALYLYQKSKGDQESGVLTIKRTPSAWHAVLNERL